MVMITESKLKELGILQFWESLDSLMGVRTIPGKVEKEEDVNAIAEFLLEKFSEIEDYDIQEVDEGWVILLWGREPYDEHLSLFHSLVVLKAPLEPAKSWLVVGCQPLSKDCLAQYKYRGYYWPQYIGGQVELTPAPRLEERDLGILYEGVELTVNAPSFPMPDWVDFELSTIIVRGENGEVQRLFLIDESDEESVQNWQIWYNSGYSDTEPEEEE